MTAKKKPKFTADLKQCETMIMRCTAPFALGGINHASGRCENKTAAVITEKKTGNELGACLNCVKQFRRINKGEMRLYSVKKVKA